MMYIIMKKEKSPIFITQARVHGYVSGGLSQAKKIVNKLNSVATSNTYWHTKAKKLE
jgi:hypothetical protein